LHPGDIALCDRNCHKSIEQGLTITGGIPVYLKPTRNHYGIIGPIRSRSFTKEAIEQVCLQNCRTKRLHAPSHY
jgi:arginine decarboxylase